MDRIETHSVAETTAARPTLPQALMVLVAVILVIAGYIFLGNALNIHEAYIGFIFVFYWMTLDQGKIDRVPALICGACFGLAASWLLQYATHQVQPALLGLFLLSVCVAIVALILGRLPLLFNAPAMLVLTVFTIPHLQQAASFPHLFGALAFAAVFFVGLVTAAAKLAKRLNPPRP